MLLTSTKCLPCESGLARAKIKEFSNKYSTKTDATKRVAQYIEQINDVMGIVLLVFFFASLLFIMQFVCNLIYNIFDDNSLCDYRSRDHT